MSSKCTIEKIKKCKEIDKLCNFLTGRCIQKKKLEKSPTIKKLKSHSPSSPKTKKLKSHSPSSPKTKKLKLPSSPYPKTKKLKSPSSPTSQKIKKLKSPTLEKNIITYSQINSNLIEKDKENDILTLKIQSK